MSSHRSSSTPSNLLIQFLSRFPPSRSLIGVVASSTGIVPGWVFPGCGIWVYLTIQGFLYTTVSEIGLYQNTMRQPPDVVSGYTKVRPSNLFFDPIQSGLLHGWPLISRLILVISGLILLGHYPSCKTKPNKRFQLYTWRLTEWYQHRSWSLWSFTKRDVFRWTSKSTWWKYYGSIWTYRHSQTFVSRFEITGLLYLFIFFIFLVIRSIIRSSYI